MSGAPPPVGSPPDDRHIYQPESARLGPVAMFLGAFLLAVMSAFAKLAHDSSSGRPIPASEVVLFRSLFSVAILLPLRGRRGIDLLGTDRRGLLLRGLAGSLGMYLYFLSLHYTSMAHAVLHNYTSLVFAPIFAGLLLDEAVNRRAALAIPIAVAGIVLITNPEMGGLRIGDLFGLLSGLVAGLAITAIRHLRQTESSWSVFFYLSAVGIPMSLVACLFQPPVIPTPQSWLILLGLGASSVGGQLLMTYGYRYVRAAEGGLIMVSQILYNVGIGVIWFQERLTVTTLAGGALILGACLWLGLRSDSNGSASRDAPGE